MANYMKLLPLLLALVLLAGVPAGVSGQQTVTVGFSATEYTVSEGAGTVSITVEATPAPTQQVQVRLSTRNGTAMSGSDYVAVNTTVTFAVNDTTETVDVTIVNNNSVEDSESFSVNLETITGQTGVAISETNGDATVEITDDDEATVGMQRNSYVVGERSGLVIVQLEVSEPRGSCPIDTSFSFRLYTQDGTAVSGQDYTAFDRDVAFDQCRIRVAVSIPIANDLTVEDTETFVVRLEGTSETPIRVTLSPTESTVEIDDSSDRATVSLESEEYSVNGGDPFELPVVISRPEVDCPVEFDFDVHVSHPGGAFAPGTPDPLVVSFNRCEARAVVSATAAALNSFRTETFSLRLQRPSDLDRRIVFLNPSTARLRVIPSRFGGLASGNDGPWGMWSDNRTVWISNEDSPMIYAYNTNTRAQDSDKEFDTLDDAGNDQLTGIWSNGTTMWVADYDDGKIYAYRMSDKARDAEKDFATLTAAGHENPTGLWSNGTTMWVADDTDGKIYAYRISDKARDTAREFNTLTIAGNAAPTGIWSNGTTMWVADDDDAKIYAYNMTTKEPDADKDIAPLASGQSDPQGLWADGQLIWVVDKTDSAIYPYLLPRAEQQPTVRRTSPTQRTTVVSVEAAPARPSAISQELCVSDVVDPDGGEIELGNTIEDAWVAGCPSVTRGGRMAKYYTFNLPITAAVEIALDSHLDDYLVLRRGGLSGEVVEQDDDDGPGNNSLISGTLTAGKYSIEATTFYADGVEADFTLSVRAVPRILYDGPVAEVAHADYSVVGPTMTVKLLPTLPMGTLEITIEDSGGFGEGVGPLGGANAEGGSAGTVILALPRSSWVQYKGIAVEVRKSGAWGATTTADEQAILSKSSTYDAGVVAVLQGLARILGQAGDASSLLRSLTDLVSPAAVEPTVEPDESLLNPIFRKAYANCVSQVTVPWLVEASETTAVRVSIPVTMSDDDYLSLAASFVASENRPALAQLHNLLHTCNEVPVCLPATGGPQ